MHIPQLHNPYQHSAKISNLLNVCNTLDDEGAVDDEDAVVIEWDVSANVC